MEELLACPLLQHMQQQKGQLHLGRETQSLFQTKESLSTTAQVYLACSLSDILEEISSLSLRATYLGGWQPCQGAALS